MCVPFVGSCINIIFSESKGRLQKKRKKVTIITFGVGGGVARVPQAPLDFPSVSCKSNTPLGAAGTPHDAANAPPGATNTLPGAANTATFTAFTSF